MWGQDPFKKEEQRKSCCNCLSGYTGQSEVKRFWMKASSCVFHDQSLMLAIIGQNDLTI